VSRTSHRAESAGLSVATTWFGFGATPAELRQAGLVAAIDKITREKAGVMLLGMPLHQRDLRGRPSLC
jgi:hypothetical protein